MRTETNGHDNLDALRINARHIADTGMPLGKRTPEHLTGAADELEARRAECERLSALVAEYENALELGTFAARYHIAWCEAAQKIAEETTDHFEAKCKRLEDENARLREELERVVRLGERRVTLGDGKAILLPISDAVKVAAEALGGDAS